MDGFYVIENHVRYSKKQNCLRVIRDGLTWSTLWSDVPHAIELRDGGEFWGAISVDGPDGELRGPLVRLGTWAKTGAHLELKWPKWTEHLVAEPPSRAFPEPPLKRPRGRNDDVLGLVIQQHDHWRGVIELDGQTEVTIDGDDFAYARTVVERLRAGALDRVKQQLAPKIRDQYNLEPTLRVDTVAVKGSVATLWFGRFDGEHSILGVLSNDCESAELDQP